MANSATVTAKIGPGVQVTSHVFEPLNSIKFDYDAMTLEINYGLDHLIRIFQLKDVTTVTDTISSNVHTWVVS